MQYIGIVRGCIGILFPYSLLTTSKPFAVCSLGACGLACRLGEVKPFDSCDA